MPKEPKALTPEGIQAYARIQEAQVVVQEAEAELLIATRARDNAILEAIEAGVMLDDPEVLSDEDD